MRVQQAQKQRYEKISQQKETHPGVLGTSASQFGCLLLGVCS